MTVTPDEAAHLRKLASSPRRATGHDLPHVVRTLTRAFENDPLMNWMGRRDTKRLFGLSRMFDLLCRRIGLRGNELWTTEDFQAVALWAPPEHAELKQSLLDEVTMLPALFSYAGVSGLDRVAAFRKQAERHHPKDQPHFYLLSIGVAPELQGHGIGSCLLESTLQEADRRNLPAYLESSHERNLPLYRRHGFDVTAQFRPREDGPWLWGMWRKARR